MVTNRYLITEDCKKDVFKTNLKDAKKYFNLRKNNLKSEEKPTTLGLYVITPGHTKYTTKELIAVSKWGIQQVRRY